MALRTLARGEDPNGGADSKETPLTGQVTKNSTVCPILLLDTQLSGRTVLDKTGLVGKYDVKLRWTPEDMRLQTDAGAGGSDETDVDFFTAVQEQLGLKLFPAKGPVNALVVDHIEKPSEN